MNKEHLFAILSALFVTMLWSSSWVLIKWGLVDIAPLPFAGIRYGLAALSLAPFVFTRTNRLALSTCSKNEIGLLIVFGIVQYALTQGCVYIALNHLPAISLSLLLSFSPILVAIIATIFLGERIRLFDLFGIALYLVGAFIYFGPNALSKGQTFGLALGVLCVCFNAIQSIMGRKINRDMAIPKSLITAVSMMAGSFALLGTALAINGVPTLSMTGWQIVGWLAIVNTAFAFWLWNRTQAILSALDSSLINNTMLIQIAILAVIFLDERLSIIQLAGLLLAAIGIFGTQIARVLEKQKKHKGV